MSFSVRIEKTALKELKKIDSENQKRIIKLIDSLKEDPYKGKQMVGRYKGLFRVRSGDYRVVYSVINDELVVLVLTVGHRREVYR
jgi:mRNA interferase RelE/StbE